MRSQSHIMLLAALLTVTAAAAQKDTLVITGVGDIMLGTSYPSGHLAPGDGKNLLKPMRAVLRNSDITFGNYEGTLFNGTGKPKQCKDSAKCFAFKSPEHYTDYLKDAGFDMISIANNHAGDFGDEGRTRTLEVLDDAGFAAAGTQKRPYVMLKQDGVTYGLACFAPNNGTPSIHALKQARRIVRYLDSLCDVVIVSFHGGAEGAGYTHVPRKKEIFLGEDRGNVYEFAHAVVDAGADIVFGHGPHVPRAVELYRDRMIAYSLGNFATYSRFSLKGDAGIAPVLKVFVDRNGKFLKARIISARQWGEGGPVLDTRHTAAKRIRQLTLEDFPDTNLVIHDNGTIVKKDQ